MKANSSIFIIAVIAFFGMAGYLAFSGEDKTAPEMAAQPAEPAAPAPLPVAAVETVPVANAYQLVETRPLQPAWRYEGRAAEAYRIAAQIPEVLDQLYCYCMCKENPRFQHKTLLTCYTDDHAANCGSCMKEAEIAWEMTQKGRTPKEIRAAVDSYYQEQNRHVPGL